MEMKVAGGAYWYWRFPSPCGEEVMKYFDQATGGDRFCRLFPSPCGEEVMKSFSL